MQVKFRAALLPLESLPRRAKLAAMGYYEEYEKGSKYEQLKKGESITHSENENGSVKANIEGSDKQKFALYITPQCMDTVNMLYKSDNCSSRSEFIEKAVKFYTGYICASKSVNYISPLLTSMLDSVVLNSEQRISRNLFKIAVELGKLSHMIAAANEVDDETLRELHIMCIDEVRKINGIITYDSAARFQRND